MSYDMPQETTFPEYISKGEGPTIFLAHGTLMDATMFEPQLDALAAAGYRGIAMNNRTYLGGDKPHTLDDLADDMAALAEKLGVTDYVAGGMSVGAFGATHFGLRHLDKVRGIVLIDGMAVDYTDEEKVMFGEKFATMNVDGPVSREDAEWSAQFCFGKTTFEKNPELVEYWINRWSTVTPSRSVWAQSTSWTHKPDVTDQLHKITKPVLMFHGEEDMPLPLSRVLSMVQEIPDLTFVKMAGIGHTSNLEDPERVNRELINFMDRLYA